MQRWRLKVLEGVYAATEYVEILFIYLVLVIFKKFLEHHLYILV